MSIKVRALSLLLPFSRPMTLAVRRRASATLRPTERELLSILRPGVFHGWRSFWSSQPVFGPTGPALRLSLHVARGRDLVRPVVGFPPRYREIAHALRPEPTWVAWSYAGDDGRSLSFDGLVHTGERFVWLPSPFFYLDPAALARPLAAVEHWAD